MSAKDREERKERVAFTTPSRLLEEWEKEIEEEEWSSRSEYIRTHIQAGRKQLATLHPSQGTSDSDTLDGDILEHVPEAGSVAEEGDIDAPDQDTVVDEVLDSMETEVCDALDRLDETGQIDYSAGHGGYVKE